MAQLKLKQLDSVLTGSLQVSGSAGVTGSLSVGGILYGPVDDHFDIKSDKDVRLYLDTDDDGTFHKFQVFNEDGDVKFAIASDGKSAIGAAVTSTSLDGLSVTGGITATGHITGSGNISGSATSTGSFGMVGIGAITNPRVGPQTKLHVFGPSKAPSDVLKDGIFCIDGSISLKLLFGSSNASPYPMWMQVTDPSEASGVPRHLLIQPIKGNVSIGSETDPPEKLTVTGNIYTTGNITGSGHISGSATSTGSFGRVETKEFIGHRPMQTHMTDFSASMAHAGYYHIVHGQQTCSILPNATVSVNTGTEYEFFQTSSIGNMLFETGSGVSLYVKNNNLNLAGQYSGASLKKVATNTWHLVGDLT